jgi:hypothetical protein
VARAGGVHNQILYQPIPGQLEDAVVHLDWRFSHQISDRHGLGGSRPKKTEPRSLPQTSQVAAGPGAALESIVPTNKLVRESYHQQPG